MAADLLAIGDALAARFLAVTPPSGQTMAGATARLPNAIPDTPFTVVVPPSGTLGMPEGFPSGRFRDEHDFDIYVLLNKASGDLPTDLVRVYAWWPVARDALSGQMKLGLAPTVTKSAMVEYDFDSYDYNGQAYHAWHFVARVWTDVIVVLTI